SVRPCRPMHRFPRIARGLASRAGFAARDARGESSLIHYVAPDVATRGCFEDYAGVCVAGSKRSNAHPIARTIGISSATSTAHAVTANVVQEKPATKQAMPPAAAGIPIKGR